MKQYIGNKIILAWAAPGKDGQPGYGVKYEDGYTNWTPKETFEATYRDIEGPVQTLTFSDALHMLKLGKKVQRTGWNGKGMFVYLVPANSCLAQTGVAKSYFGEDALVPYAAYMAIKNTNETVSTWIPSVNDCLAEDWQVVG